jgi:hypothetical protein
MAASSPRDPEARRRAAVWRFLMATAAGCGWWFVPPPELWSAINGCEYHPPGEEPAPDAPEPVREGRPRPVRLRRAERRAWNDLVARLGGR